jgi:acetylornithine deacetylase/succinyl-diaminopimelate desuccinylase-like protein
MRLLLALLAAGLVAAVGGTRADAPQAVRAQALDIFRSVIGYKTSIGLHQVPVMAEYLAGKFRAGGFANEDIHVLPYEETASLVVRYRGNGKGGKPILLLAHMDVVTANREDWERDPYTLIEENGFFFGRGTYDIKGEIALLTETFLRLKAEHFVPTRDLVIVFSGDEETAQATTRDLVDKHRDLVDAEFALNADGGGGAFDELTGKAQLYTLQGAEKASVTFELTVHNPGGHSSRPRNDNAIYELADALKAVQAYRFPVMWNDWTLGGFKASAAATPGELGQAMARFAANPRDAAAADILYNSPQDVGRTRTTCVATMLKAGHAENALPQTATAVINCRVFPGTSVEEVKGTLQKLAGEKVELKLINNPAVAKPSPIRGDVIAAVTKAVHSVYPGTSIVPDMVPYATDGAIFSQAGIPTYGVSSTFIKESELLSHGLNERLPVESFYNGLTYFYVLLKELAGKR